MEMTTTILKEALSDKKLSQALRQDFDGSVESIRQSIDAGERQLDDTHRQLLDVVSKVRQGQADAKEAVSLLNQLASAPVQPEGLAMEASTWTRIWAARPVRQLDQSFTADGNGGWEDRGREISWVENEDGTVTLASASASITLTKADWQNRTVNGQTFTGAREKAWAKAIHNGLGLDGDKKSQSARNGLVHRIGQALGTRAK